MDFKIRNEQNQHNKTDNRDYERHFVLIRVETFCKIYIFDEINLILININVGFKYLDY